MQKVWLSSQLQHLKVHPFKYGFFLFLFVFIAISIIVVTQLSKTSSNEQINNRHYTYETIQASNDVIIHVLRTKPHNIHLQSINMNVVESGFNGINGGFFWMEHLLSIAVENDLPVQGAPRKFGSGWFNAKYPRGTLVYDQISNIFTVQIVNNVDEIKVTDRTRYWAQGGVSMNLSDPLNWENMMNVEALPYPNDSRLRSGMVYDQEGFVYLIISSTQCTAAQFRSAILEQVPKFPLLEGIFLDGDGSSQMSADDLKLIGDGRKVTQMIRIN
jgi:hypothetical protein